MRHSPTQRAQEGRTCAAHVLVARSGWNRFTTRRKLHARSSGGAVHCITSAAHSVVLSAANSTLVCIAYTRGANPKQPFQSMTYHSFCTMRTVAIPVSMGCGAHSNSKLAGPSNAPSFTLYHPIHNAHRTPWANKDIVLYPQGSTKPICSAMH